MSPVRTIIWDARGFHGGLTLTIWSECWESWLIYVQTASGLLERTKGDHSGLNRQPTRPTGNFFRLWMLSPMVLVKREWTLPRSWELIGRDQFPGPDLTIWSIRSSKSPKMGFPASQMTVLSILEIGILFYFWRSARPYLILRGFPGRRFSINTFHKK